MADPDFNDISFMMEYEGKFYGSGEDSLFKLDVLENRRNLKTSFRSLEYYRNTNTKPPMKQAGEKRMTKPEKERKKKKKGKICL